MRHLLWLYHRRKLTLLLACILCLMAYGVGWAEDAPLRDYWSVVEKAGTAVGLSHTQEWATESGFRYAVDVTLQIDFGGSGPIRITQQYDVHTDALRAMQSFAMVSQINDSITVIKGAVAEHELHVDVTNPNGKTDSRIWRLEHPVYFEDALYEQLANEYRQQPKPSVTAQVWDFLDVKLAAKSYSIAAGSHEYKGKQLPGIILTDPDGIRTFIDETGVVYWQEAPQEAVTARFITEDEIPELKSLSMDTLTVKSNMVVNRPYASTASQLQVDWKDVDFAAFNWEDNRQRLEKHETTPTGHTVLLSLQKDTRDFTGRVALPVQDPAFAAYLADTDYVLPSSPAVKQLLADIVGAETDGWTVTRKLAEWVFDYIQPAMIPETLTAEQIIEKKHGKCVEYAVLFASLARAAGLPTRLALGERFDSNMWIGHMWNEVWLGEWVTVDASHNQVAPDALLLKFVHSDTVTGTQNVRWGLVGKLNITINNVTLAQDNVTHLETGIKAQTYTNADFTCRITAPEGWSITEAQEQGLPMAVIKSPADSRTYGIMLMFSVPAGTRLDQIMSTRIPAIRGALPGFVLLETETSPIGQQSLAAATGAWLYKQGEVQIHQENWLAINGDVCYLFVFNAPADDWTSANAQFQSIRNSFTVVQP